MSKTHPQLFLGFHPKHLRVAFGENLKKSNLTKASVNTNYLKRDKLRLVLKVN